MSDDTIKGARIVSAVFSPIVIPTYCTMIVMWVTPMSILPEGIRFMASLAVFGLTAVMPILILLALKRMGRITDLDVSRRSQRLLPLAMVLVCYILCALYMYRGHAFWWLVMYYVSGCVTALIAAVISTRWKISAHAAGMGNMAGMFAALMAAGYAQVNMLPWLCVAILLSGVVGSARLVLERHTLAQVVAGWCLSAVVTAVMMTTPLFQSMYD